MPTQWNALEWVQSLICECRAVPRIFDIAAAADFAGDMLNSELWGFRPTKCCAVLRNSLLPLRERVVAPRLGARDHYLGPYWASFWHMHVYFGCHWS